MLRIRIISCLLALLTLTIAGCAEEAPKSAPGHSPCSPAPLGVGVEGIIECGKGYTSHELYGIKITLLEVVRGEEAWERIKGASTSNEPPDSGFEYALARIRFEYFARGSPGDCSHELRREQFTAFSPDGKEYETPSVVLSKPELSGKLYSGDSLEGWLTFLVAQDDSKPLMTFAADPGGGVEHGGDIWFMLH